MVNKNKLLHWAGALFLLSGCGDKPSPPAQASEPAASAQASSEFIPSAIEAAAPGAAQAVGPTEGNNTETDTLDIQQHE